MAVRVTDPDPLGALQEKPTPAAFPALYWGPEPSLPGYWNPVRLEIRLPKGKRLGGGDPFLSRPSTPGQGKDLGPPHRSAPHPATAGVAFTEQWEGCSQELRNHLCCQRGTRLDEHWSLTRGG